MTSEELVIEYIRVYPPHMNHQEAEEDLVALLEQVKKEQRQICATDITEYAEMRSESLSGATEKLADICLNATGAE